MIKKITLIFTLLMAVGTITFAQNILKGKDLKQVRVDELSDGDIAKLKAQLITAGITIDQAEPRRWQIFMWKPRVKKQGIMWPSCSDKPIVYEMN